jgi:hypothetical protein
MPNPPARTGAASAAMPFRAEHVPADDRSGHPKASGAASTSASVDAMRRHVTDLCIWYRIVPVVGSPREPRVRAGMPEVALQYIGDLSGYWGCLHDIGLALADVAWDAFECELRAWSWACEVALIAPGADVFDLALAALCAEQALGVSGGAPAPLPFTANHLADCCRLHVPTHTRGVNRRAETSHWCRVVGDHG